MSTNIYKHV